MKSDWNETADKRPHSTQSGIASEVDSIRTAWEENAY